MPVEILKCYIYMLFQSTSHSLRKILNTSMILDVKDIGPLDDEDFCLLVMCSKRVSSHSH